MINVAIVGASGLVGKEFLYLLENSNIKIGKLKLFASESSIDKKIIFRNKNYSILPLKISEMQEMDFAIFCTDSNISAKYIPLLKDFKTICIDLSSHFRMDPNVPLIIPEINKNALATEAKLIASPNCTTTILLMPLHLLHKYFNIKRIIVSTYQAASGGGKKLIDKLFEDTKNSLTDNFQMNSFGFNLFLHESKMQDNRYNEEEIKVINETRKILNDDKIKINATCVRVPVIRAHSLSVNVEFTNAFSLDEIYRTIQKSENVKIIEDYSQSRFITPKEASNKNEVFVSRIRNDLSNPKAIDMWICADQLLKGASLNAFQIMNSMINS